MSPAAGGLGRVGHGSGELVLDALIGRGGMAEVFLAHRSVGGFARKFVVKRILPAYAANETFVKRFVREAGLVAQFHHPNIVEIYDLRAEAGEYYIVMEYLDGRNLNDVLDRLHALGRPCPPVLAARVIADAASALDYAHTFRTEGGGKRTIIHRDISPDNLMLTFKGEVKLLDFGVAKDAEATKLTRAGEVVGKPVYFPPECIKGLKPTPAWDIYSLGATLYETVTGRPPFEQAGEGIPELTDLFERIVKEEPPAPRSVAPRVPARLEKIILRAMAKKPRARYPTALAMRDDLEAFAAESRHPSSAAALAAFMQEVFGGDAARAPVGAPSRRAAPAAAEPVVLRRRRSGGVRQVLAFALAGAIAAAAGMVAALAWTRAEVRAQAAAAALQPIDGPLRTPLAMPPALTPQLPAPPAPAPTAVSPP